ncbi:alpha/beta hydrolase [Nonomuraea sp. LP-02]|uniref:alpha/beta hydrolase n=1 Tax=Nonomuraea sp. LP-02 TaxID=3097960 RepID=UPI002E2FF66B|nr:alpha/beta hydrolase [Nonomuraea sp. LP-02]MED7931107.1 alpha/beta hydrolase [Nonomuraea sp. LP-02]
MNASTARPGLDPELRELLSHLPLVPELTPELLAQFRLVPSPPPDLDGRAVERREVSGTVPLSVFSPPGHPAAAPAVLWLHGGGMIMGDRYSQLDIPLEWLDLFGAVVISVEYRLAPEATGTTLVEDCYRGLLWVAEHAGELGIDPQRIVVAGTSAGGGLAAGLALLARDRGGPRIAAQMLICPMLDHRNDTPSGRQHSGGPGVWTRETNAFAWRSVIGSEEVSAYVSPAIAEDLSGLPTAFIDAGTAEVFRDEDVAYATRIWEAGGQAELHVWAGGYHGFDALFPKACLSIAARRARNDWLARILQVSP